MRVLRVSELTGKRRGSGIQSAPRPGTKLRRVYDALEAGGAVFPEDFPDIKVTNFGNVLSTLRDFYGCEIDHVGYGKGYTLR